MKKLLLVLVYIGLAAAAPAPAASQDSASSPRAQTLFGLRAIRAVHFDVGSSAVPYVRSDNPGSMQEARLVVTLNRWPEWSFAVAGGGLAEGDSTDYIAPGSKGYHPRINESHVGFEVQRRWKSTSLLHPLATATIGSLTNVFEYWEYPFAGGSIHHRDLPSTTSYFNTEAGGELNLARWMRLTLTVGYRAAGDYHWPTGTMHNSGTTATMLFEFGKF